MKIISATINGKHTVDLQNHDFPDLDILSIDDTNYNIIVNSRSLKVEVIETNYLEKKYKIKVDNKIYNVHLNNELDKLIDEMGLSTEQAKEVNEIKAPMPGLLLQIMVKTGTEVKEDEPLLVLEAMKMENVILSPKAGIIKSVQVEAGDTVEKNDLLIEFE